MSARTQKHSSLTTDPVLPYAAPKIKTVAEMDGKFVYLKLRGADKGCVKARVTPQRINKLVRIPKTAHNHAELVQRRRHIANMHYQRRVEIANHEEGALSDSGGE